MAEQQRAVLQLWLLRHGETEWSLSEAHTSRTDIPLTEQGRQQALGLQGALKTTSFRLVLSSPMQRVQETCRLAGLADELQVEPNLREWDYGIYEGRTTAEIRREHPGWSVWKDALPEGETVDEVGARAQAVIDRCMEAGGAVALFAHAHCLRILAAVWLGLPPSHGRLFALSTGSLSLLGFEREERVLQLWNKVPDTGMPEERKEHSSSLEAQR